MPDTRLPPRAAKGQPSRAARGFRPKRQTRFREGAKTALRFGSPRNPFPLATPVSPTGKGCSSSCNPNQRQQEAVMTSKEPEKLAPHFLNQFTGSENWYRGCINRRV